MKRIGLSSVALLLLAGLLLACGATPEPQAVYLPEAPVPMEKPVAGKEAAESGGSADLDLDTTERMVIWNASVYLTVEDAEESLTAIQSLARELGGYPISSESWLEDEQVHARLTIRVPAERFDEALSRIRDLGLRVDRESANSEDVTDQYVDLESRLRHLEAKEAQLLKFMEDAENTKAVLSVYKYLDETQAEIEQVKGKMKYLSSLSAMGTITVEMYPEEAEPPVIEEGWNPGRTLRDAARALLRVLKALANLAIWLTVFGLPLLLFVALPIALIVWAIRRRKARSTSAETDEQQE